LKERTKNQKRKRQKVTTKASVGKNLQQWRHQPVRKDKKRKKGKKRRRNRTDEKAINEKRPFKQHSISRGIPAMSFP